MSYIYPAPSGKYLSNNLFPYSILAREGKVLWTGHPTELESVISRVRAGTFSLASQRKVESLRRELQMAIQSGLPRVMEQTAEKILAVSQSDRIAIQAKLMALNASGIAAVSAPSTNSKVASTISTSPAQAAL